VRRFADRFARDLPALTEQGLATYHAWAFGTVRQLGAAFELAALYARWLGDGPAQAAVAPFETISSVAKAFILKAARAVNARRALDAEPMFAEMAQAWQQGLDILAEASRASQ
jgi:hypothetical protein